MKTSINPSPSGSGPVQNKNAEHSEMHAQQGNQSSHHLRGAVPALNLFPGYAKNAYPGLMYLHASGVTSPNGLHGT